MAGWLPTVGSRTMSPSLEYNRTTFLALPTPIIQQISPQVFEMSHSQICGLVNNSGTNLAMVVERSVRPLVVMVVRVGMVGIVGMVGVVVVVEQLVRPFSFLLPFSLLPTQ